MPPITIPEGVDYLATGDFNGDGKADLVAMSDSSDGLTVLLGNGDGTFAAVAAHPAAEYEILDVVVGDFNGDGTPDLAVQTYAPGAQISVAILLGNGDGTFKSGQVLPFPNGSSYLVGADFKGDGVLDLAGSNYVGGSCPSSGSVLVLLGKGDGSFAPAAISPSAGSCPGPMAVRDFNGDGIADMVVLDSDDTITVLLGNGDGTFAAPLNFSAGPESVIVDHPIFLTVGDFNGDGLTDVAIADNGTNSVAILLAQWTPSAGAASAARH
jgi:FG-GAP-like repeat